ncbi:MAG: diguanylate cyclase, partial [Rhodocyclales bacterium]|nr:diguanylate cyclase [Rhodocyclales bacterium]
NPAPARLPDWVWLAFAAGALFLLLAGTAVWHYMRMAGRLGREIAERRIADQELQATRRNIAALLDATQSFAALLDLNGDILSINTHGAARFGGTCDEIVGRNIYELSTPEVGAGRRRAAEQAVRERRVIVLEDERAGRHLRSTVVPVVEENGDIRRVAVFAEDTTERTLAEIALRASEERYRFLAENTADIVWQADANLVFTYVNDAVEKLLGIPRNEAVGLPLTQLLTPESLETVRRLQTERLAADQAGQAPATAQFELELMCRDGGTVWTEISSTPIRSETGAITGYFGITRDITERKHAEHRLRAANERLTKQITEIQGLQDTLKQQVVRDSLTGLYNRRYLDETLEREIARAKREGHPLSLVMIDVDHFKRLNDTYGHQAGDQVLIALGILLRADTRTEDVPCRFGGEEFLVLMPHMSLESAKDRAELWRSRFAELSVSHGELTVGTTISLGVSAYPDHGHTPDELIQSADLALYLAKRDGRNRVVVFEPAPVLSVGV